MIEVTERIYIDADGKRVSSDGAVAKVIAPGRITEEEAEALGLEVNWELDPPEVVTSGEVVPQAVTKNVVDGEQDDPAAADNLAASPTEADDAAAQRHLEHMTKDELVAEAQERGVSFDPSWTKQQIREAIEVAS